MIADLDFWMIDKRKRMMDSRGYYSRPELLRLQINHTAHAHVHKRGEQAAEPIAAASAEQE